MPSRLKVDAEPHASPIELGLGGRECGVRFVRATPHDDRAQCRVGEVGQREHEAVDLEDLRSGDVRATCSLRSDEPERESFRSIHDPSLPVTSRSVTAGG